MKGRSAMMTSEVVVATSDDLAESRTSTNRWLTGEVVGHEPDQNEAIHEYVRRSHGWSQDHQFEVVIMSLQMAA